MKPAALKGAPLPYTPIKTVLLVIALEAEVAPFVKALKLAADNDSVFPAAVPWVKLSGTYEGIQVHVVTPGTDSVHGVDAVGTVPAAMLTFASIQALKPDLIINAGTAGGFKSKGACIGDVFLVTESAFHDRRIPIPGYTQYGVGALKATPVTKLVDALGFKVGCLTTGDSLDKSTDDEPMMKANDATVKDMEGAAVAYVADMFSVPLILLKAVTDIVDGGVATDEEFLQNLSLASSALEKSLIETLNYLAGKRLSDLSDLKDNTRNSQVFYPTKSTSQEGCFDLVSVILCRTVLGDLENY